MVNGRLSAGGNAALQDDAGGGSGGSIWLTAGALAGTGTIAADGGAGELYDGGGGGGGRIAIYTPLNVFGGLVSAAGGNGLLRRARLAPSTLPSQPGAPQVVSFTPSASLTSAVSSCRDCVQHAGQPVFGLGPDRCSHRAGRLGGEQPQRPPR